VPKRCCDWKATTLFSVPSGPRTWTRCVRAAARPPDARAADRSQGIGSTEVALLTGWLFEHESIMRVQAGTAVDNTAMRRAFERPGFAYEGIMRGFIAAHAGREDCALYALPKDTWHGQVTEQ
jgi:hypothetical protein